MIASIRFTGAAFVLFLGMWPLLAGADAAVPISISNTYKASIQGSTVIVCVDSVANYGSPPPPEETSIFLRYDRGTRQLVALGLKNVFREQSLCGPWDWTRACNCMKDECVPPGTYRYGWSPALETCGEIWVQATVRRPIKIT
jgi:hypothetical protein